MYSNIRESYPSCCGNEKKNKTIQENFGGAFSIYGALKNPRRNCSPVVDLNYDPYGVGGAGSCPKIQENFGEGGHGGGGLGAGGGGYGLGGGRMGGGEYGGGGMDRGSDSSGGRSGYGGGGGLGGGYAGGGHIDGGSGYGAGGLSKGHGGGGYRGHGGFPIGHRGYRYHQGYPFYYESSNYGYNYAPWYSVYPDTASTGYCFCVDEKLLQKVDDRYKITDDQGNTGVCYPNWDCNNCKYSC